MVFHPSISSVHLMYIPIHRKSIVISLTVNHFCHTVPLILWTTHGKEELNMRDIKMTYLRSKYKTFLEEAIF